MAEVCKPATATRPLAHRLFPGKKKRRGDVCGLRTADCGDPGLGLVEYRMAAVHGYCMLATVGVGIDAKDEEQRLGA